MDEFIYKFTESILNNNQLNIPPSITRQIAEKFNLQIKKQCQVFDGSALKLDTFDLEFKKLFPNLDRVIYIVSILIDNYFNGSVGLRAKLGETRFHKQLTDYNEKFIKNIEDIKNIINDFEKNYRITKSSKRVKIDLSPSSAKPECDYINQQENCAGKTKEKNCKNNSFLKGSASDNCFNYTDKSKVIFRVLPWIKHYDIFGSGKIKYTLTCMCCGLPINMQNKEIFNTDYPPPSLEKLTGVECDHILFFIAMYLGLHNNTDLWKNINSELWQVVQNIGIGSNFVPLHSSCNWKKTNLPINILWNYTSDYANYKNNAIKMRKWINTYWKRSETNSPIIESKLSNYYEIVQNKFLALWNNIEKARELQIRYYSAIEYLTFPNNLINNKFNKQLLPLKENVDKAMSQDLKGPVPRLTSEDEAKLLGINLYTQGANAVRDTLTSKLATIPQPFMSRFDALKLDTRKFTQEQLELIPNLPAQIVSTHYILKLIHPEIERQGHRYRDIIIEKLADEYLPHIIFPEDLEKQSEKARKEYLIEYFKNKYGDYEDRLKTYNEEHITSILSPVILTELKARARLRAEEYLKRQTEEHEKKRKREALSSHQKKSFELAFDVFKKTLLEYFEISEADATKRISVFTNKDNYNEKIHKFRELLTNITDTCETRGILLNNKIHDFFNCLIYNIIKIDGKDIDFKKLCEYIIKLETYEQLCERGKSSEECKIYLRHKIKSLGECLAEFAIIFIEKTILREVKKTQVLTHLTREEEDKEDKEVAKTKAIMEREARYRARTSSQATSITPLPTVEEGMEIETETLNSKGKAGLIKRRTIKKTRKKNSSSKNNKRENKAQIKRTIKTKRKKRKGKTNRRKSRKSRKSRKC
jgi:hypothetical protein